MCKCSASRPGRDLPRGKDHVPIKQEAGCASELVWTQILQEKSFASAGDRTSVVQSAVRHYTDRTKIKWANSIVQCLIRILRHAILTCFNTWKQVVTTYTMCFHIKTVSFTDRVYESQINGFYSIKQHQLRNLWNGQLLCSLCGKDLIPKYR
jgi:hypothetical protein